MKALPLLVLVVGLAAPMASLGEPEAANDPTPSRRDSSRLLLMAGSGIPLVVNAEADLVIVRHLALTARVGTFPPLFFTGAVGLMGIVPLSSDRALIPRHALGFGADVGPAALMNTGGPDNLAREREPRPLYTVGTVPSVSAGYLFTSQGGFHLRLMVGLLLPMDLVDGSPGPLVPDFRLALGGIP